MTSLSSTTSFANSTVTRTIERYSDFHAQTVVVSKHLLYNSGRHVFDSNLRIFDATLQANRRNRKRGLPVLFYRNACRSFVQIWVRILISPLKSRLLKKELSLTGIECWPTSDIPPVRIIAVKAQTSTRKINFVFVCVWWTLKRL